MKREATYPMSVHSSTLPAFLLCSLKFWSLPAADLDRGDPTFLSSQLLVGPKKASTTQFADFWYASSTSTNNIVAELWCTSLLFPIDVRLKVNFHRISLWASGGLTKIKLSYLPSTQSADEINLWWWVNAHDKTTAIFCKRSSFRIVIIFSFPIYHRCRTMKDRSYETSHIHQVKEGGNCQQDQERSFSNKLHYMQQIHI